MSGSTPSSVSRYRPAILVFAGAAAAYAAYLVYSTVQASPANGLQRSNAVRRRPRAPSVRALALSMGRYAREEIPSLGQYNLLGTSIQLRPRELVSPTELRAIIAQADPNVSDEAVETAIADLYNVFLDRLFVLMFPNRPATPIQVEAVRTWIGQRIPDNTAVVRAAERHAESVPSGAAPAANGAESVAATDRSWGSDEDTEGDTIDPDGQTLQRTLYHIAEDRARQEGVIHRGITCNGCDEKPIRGVRWHCANCVDFDLCSNCEATNSHYKTHIFYKIRVPAPYLGLPKQEPLYPGKPHMLSPSIDAALRKRLVAETKMEAEEIEALWDQFSCLAGTEWPEDTNGVGWALNRRAFNHAFVPRYNSFVAAPNLIYDRIFAYYDTDTNGLIGFDEWIKGIDGMHTTDVEVKARIVFNGYDIDGDGYVSRRDILRIFRAFYAIEREATRNYVAELTEDLSVRNALDTIRSSQPLGSAFPPGNMSASNADNPDLRGKVECDGLQVLRENDVDVAERDDILRMTNIQNLLPEEMPLSEQEQIVVDRWARRHFYVDEEEGLSRPAGVATEPIGEASVEPIRESDGPSSANQESGPVRLSSSSSRVRFQDDVDVDTRSNASTSSRPVGERWGGYEIPELEKDLGREVLYQITQQGFNELLNPLFEDKEDMAMDVDATRNERRKHAAAVKEITEKAEEDSIKTRAEAISQIGFFRFSKCVVDTFCKALNSGIVYPTFRSLFQNEDGTAIARTKAKHRLGEMFAAAEATVLSSIEVVGRSDKMTLWNMCLCRDQLNAEVLETVLDCATNLGWLPYPVSHAASTQNASLIKLQSVHRDPTMPQFRPNSLADIEAAWTSPSNSTSGTAESSSSETDELIVYHNHDGVDYIASDPQGPFFAFTMPELKPSDIEQQEEKANEALGSGQALPQVHVLFVPPEEPVAAVEPSTSAAVPGQESSERQKALVDYSLPGSFSPDPAIHLIFVDSKSGVDILRYSARNVTHSINPYQPEPDHLKPLIRRIRQLAMNPQSQHHLPFLASLETMEQEISERKGGGLINFNEFLEHMVEGRLRFLESWMEWWLTVEPCSGFLKTKLTDDPHMRDGGPGWVPYARRGGVRFRWVDTAMFFQEA